MKIKKELANGKYLTATTRRANYVDIFFGKLTLWRSKKDYEIGNCEEAITYTNIHLGNNLDNAERIILGVATNP